ncbi:54S ribosomal protein L11, mitochondrial [Cymbomonas tetramitiformis]|uniref:Large ribosomal subunit protein uL11m n=1 Tax=Cymbomonas tetramitiformis TaxID=36881 RepID=A0AAE0GWD9_9CHLO|nr:54S ribosomal protein L11, mitochondrial [Cymbomonas tetramitiformis]
MSKTITATIKLVVKAGQAKPSPPVGPALGQHGLNIMGFCKEFNAKTADYKPDVPVPVSITAYADKTFEFVTKMPPTSYFLKAAAGLDKSSQRPGHNLTGFVTLKHIYEISKDGMGLVGWCMVEAGGVGGSAVSENGRSGLQFAVHNAGWCLFGAGTARSMGIRVVGQQEMEELEAKAGA